MMIIADILLAIVVFAALCLPVGFYYQWRHAVAERAKAEALTQQENELEAARKRAVHEDFADGFVLEQHEDQFE